MEIIAVLLIICRCYKAVIWTRAATI